MTVTISPGTPVGMFIAGGGYGSAAKDIKARAHLAATALTDTLGGEAEIRFNSGGKTGGAWMVTAPGAGIHSNVEVGVSVDARPGFSVRVANIALRPTSAHRTPMGDYTPDPSVPDDPASDPWVGRDLHYYERFASIEDVKAFLRVHVRPAAEVSADIRTRVAARAKWQAENTWWVHATTLDEGGLIVVARRDVTVNRWLDPAREALRKYVTACSAFNSNYPEPAIADTHRLRTRLNVTLPDGGLEPGRVYRITTGGLEATRYFSPKVAAA